MERTIHPNAEKLSDAILDKKANYETFMELLSDPEVLASIGWFPTENGGKTICPHLDDAIRYDNFPAVQAILDVTKNPENDRLIIEKMRNEGILDRQCPSHKSMYIWATSGGVTVNPLRALQSPAMLQLLHDKGYDINMREPGRIGSSIYECFIERILDNFNRQHLYKIVIPLFDKAIALGVDPQGKWYRTAPNVPCGGLAEYAYHKLCGKADSTTNSILFAQQAETIPSLFAKFAQRGIDCRAITTLPVTQPDHSVHTRVIKELRQLTEQSLKGYLNPLGDHALLANVACACGTFPTLLHEVIKTDKVKNTSEGFDRLTGYLDDYWKNEYRNIIDATEARTTPVGKTTLADYVRNESPSNTGPSV